MSATALGSQSLPSIGARTLQLVLHILALLLLVGCVVASPTAQSSTEIATNGSPPPGRVGKIGLLSGTVTLTDLQTGEQQPASLNWPITSGYRLSAGPLARAEVRIGSVAVRLDGDSEVDFARIDDQLIQIAVLRGSVALRARNREVLQDIDLVTPRERIVFDDVGRYRIDVDRTRGITAVTAWNGAVRVATGRATYEVRSGQRGELSNAPGAGVTLVQAAPDTFDDWVAARDRRDDAIASTQYVSPEMTGVEVLDYYGSWRTAPEYGAVWYPAAVPVGWAPYRYGRWAYVSPWGWTWIDEAPWGFAPFHYGRWALIGGVWGWVPGAWVARPIYAPALVGWYGAPGVSVTVGYGSVGWFPLAPYEVYIPPYYYNRRYITGVNVSHVGNIDYGRISPPRSYVHQRPNTSTWVPNDAIIRQEPIKRVVRTPPADAGQLVARPTPPPALDDAAKRRVVNVAPAIPSAPTPVPGSGVVRPAPRGGMVETPDGRSQPAPGAAGRKIETAPGTPAPATAMPPTRRPEFVTRPQPAPAPVTPPPPAPPGAVDVAPVRKPMVPPPATAPRPDVTPHPMPAPPRVEPAPKIEQGAPQSRAPAPAMSSPPPMRGPQADFVVRTPPPPKVEAPRIETPRVEPPRASPSAPGEPPRGGKTQREP